MPDPFDVCETCGHYRSEHDGPCHCGVLMSRILEPARWGRCACAGYTETGGKL